jgi:hypothetical protein
MRSVKYFCASAAIISAQPRMHSVTQSANHCGSDSGYCGFTLPEISSQPNDQ